MSFDEFEAFRLDSHRWLPAALAIAREQGIESPHPEVFRSGTNLIVALNSLIVLKVFPPMLKHQFKSERAVLRFLEGRLSVPIPGIRFEGESQGWTFLGMSRLPGETGERIWPELSEVEKLSLLRRIGRLIAEVQSLGVEGLEPLEPSWDQFLPGQIAGCRAHHARLKLPEKFLVGIESYLLGAQEAFPESFRPSILTGEYIPENFLCQRIEGVLHFSGLIDFGDSMTGFPEYDLIGPGLFLVQGDPDRMKALLEGYGARPSRDLRRRLMLMTLLHRYSHLEVQIRTHEWKSRAGDLHELERLIWPIAD